MEYRELNQAEGEALTKDLQEVLAKHGAEMQTKTTIELVKRIDEPEKERKAQDNSQSAADEGSESDSGKSS